MKKVLTIGIIFLFCLTSVFSQSKKTWEKTQTLNSISAYQVFIEKYPEGQYTDQAKQKLAQLKDEEFKRQEFEAQQEAKRYGSFTDPRDGKTYKTINIGSQTWMAENLAWLPSVNSPSHGSNSEPCYYVDDYNGNIIDEAKSTNYYATYGVLYNWTAAMTCCPSGWHLPSDDDWNELIKKLGGGDIAGYSIRTKTGWRIDNFMQMNGNGDNSSGFSALPAGARMKEGIVFMKGTNAFWWTTLNTNDGNIWYRNIDCFRRYVMRINNGMPKECGMSVRCLMDK